VDGRRREGGVGWGRRGREGVRGEGCKGGRRRKLEGEKVCGIDEKSAAPTQMVVKEDSRLPFVLKKRGGRTRAGKFKGEGKKRRS